MVDAKVYECIHHPQTRSHERLIQELGCFEHCRKYLLSSMIMPTRCKHGSQWHALQTNIQKCQKQSVSTACLQNVHFPLLKFFNTTFVYHTHRVLMATFPGESGLASCHLASSSPFIPKLCLHLEQD